MALELVTEVCWKTSSVLCAHLHSQGWQHMCSRNQNQSYIHELSLPVHREHAQSGKEFCLNFLGIVQLHSKYRYNLLTCILWTKRIPSPEITMAVMLQSSWWDNQNTKAFWEGLQKCSGFPLRQRFVLLGKLHHGYHLALQRIKMFLGVIVLRWLHAQRNCVLQKYIDSMFLMGAGDFLATMSSSVLTGLRWRSSCTCRHLHWAWVWNG